MERVQSDVDVVLHPDDFDPVSLHVIDVVFAEVGVEDWGEELASHCFLQQG